MGSVDAWLRSLPNTADRYDPDPLLDEIRLAAKLFPRKRYYIPMVACELHAGRAPGSSIYPHAPPSAAPTSLPSSASTASSSASLSLSKTALAQAIRTSTTTTSSSVVATCLNCRDAGLSPEELQTRDKAIREIQGSSSQKEIVLLPASFNLTQLCECLQRAAALTGKNKTPHRHVNAALAKRFHGISQKQLYRILIACHAHHEDAVRLCTDFFRVWDPQGQTGYVFADDFVAEYVRVAIFNVIRYLQSAAKSALEADKERRSGVLHSRYTRAHNPNKFDATNALDVAFLNRYIIPQGDLAWALAQLLGEEEGRYFADVCISTFPCCPAHNKHIYRANTRGTDKDKDKQRTVWGLKGGSREEASDGGRPEVITNMEGLLLWYLTIEEEVAMKRELSIMRRVREQRTSLLTLEGKIAPSTAAEAAAAVSANEEEEKTRARTQGKGKKEEEQEKEEAASLQRNGDRKTRVIKMHPLPQKEGQDSEGGRQSDSADAGNNADADDTDDEEEHDEHSKAEAEEKRDYEEWLQGVAILTGGSAHSNENELRRCKAGRSRSRIDCVTPSGEVLSFHHMPTSLSPSPFVQTLSPSRLGAPAVSATSFLYDHAHAHAPTLANASAHPMAASRPASAGTRAGEPRPTSAAAGNTRVFLSQPASSPSVFAPVATMHRPSPSPSPPASMNPALFVKQSLLPSTASPSPPPDSRVDPSALMRAQRLNVVRSDVRSAPSGSMAVPRDWSKFANEAGARAGQQAQKQQRHHHHRAPNMEESKGTSGSVLPGSNPFPLRSQSALSMTSPLKAKAKAKGKGKDEWKGRTFASSPSPGPSPSPIRASAFPSTSEDADVRFRSIEEDIREEREDPREDTGAIESQVIREKAPSALLKYADFELQMRDKWLAEEEKRREEEREREEKERAREEEYAVARTKIERRRKYYDRTFKKGESFYVPASTCKSPLFMNLPTKPLPKPFFSPFQQYGAVGRISGNTKELMALGVIL